MCEQVQHHLFKPTGPLAGQGIGTRVTGRFALLKSTKKSAQFCGFTGSSVQARYVVATAAVFPSWETPIWK
jgi:hypothetical protein